MVQMLIQNEILVIFNRMLCKFIIIMFLYNNRQRAHMFIRFTEQIQVIILSIRAMSAALGKRYMLQIEIRYNPTLMIVYSVQKVLTFMFKQYLNKTAGKIRKQDLRICV